MITTDRQVQALKPEKGVYWESVKSPHGGGLAIRVQPSGSKSWYFRYRFNGKQDSYSFGRYPSMGLQEVREAHKDAANLLAQGINPKRVRKERKEKNQAAWTMGELFAKWIISYAKTPSTRTKRPPSETVVEQTAWRWNYYLKDHLGELLVMHVDSQRIKGTISDVAATQSREQARKCLTLLRSMFDFAEARGQVENNPAYGIEPSKVGASKSAPRERKLDLTELGRLWAAIEQARLASSTAAAIKLLILTGQRRGELLLTKWGHIDLDAGIWKIPASNAKNRKAHTVYLSTAAVGLLLSLPRHGEFVFPGRVEGQPLGANAITTAVLRLQGRKTRKRDKKAPLGDMVPFSAHDLRRSFATGLGEYCATQPHVIERMLNHVPEDSLVATYQRAEYAEEQRRAWQAWGELIESQVAHDPKNVVPMRRAME
ncbi:tyrosine-type recombinase/integrase [Halomonas aquatica]|uniref:Integrase arm-type DNA-binding domain-containing protein n=1 Tax=Halomonas aquatica TaxID=3151123 RepID=A0ABV1NI40_9GAMM